MKTRTLQRCLSLLLVFVMVLSVVPVTARAAETSTVVIAGSDFQNSSGNSASAATVTSILNQIKKDHTTADGFLFAGDYSQGSDTTGGLSALDEAVEAVFPGVANAEVYVKGNHDSVISGIAASGDQPDQSAYDVFVINESDYGWYGGNESTVTNTAANLKSYLDAKLADGYSKPIFVVSHVPLHYSMRTKNEGDGKYANLLFNELNAAGEKGLNIFFLYGHDHSNGWDDYLGGSCVYLEKGDSINIAQSSKTSFKAETLHFTYLNAGYTGYYNLENTGANNHLTMTVFEISDNEVVISRYDANGKHGNLKGVGVKNSYKNESGYEPNTETYAAPQTVALTAAAPAPAVTVSQTDASARLTVGGSVKLAAEVKNFTSQNVTYTWESSNSDVATVSDQTRAAGKAIVTGVAAGTAVITVTATAGEETAKATFNATVKAPTDGGSTTEITYVKVNQLSEITSGEQYLIVFAENSNGLQYNAATPVYKVGSSRKGLTPKDIGLTSAPDEFTGDHTDCEWTLTGSGSQYVVSASNGILQIQDSNANLGGVANHTITFAGAGTYTLTDGSYYLADSSQGLFSGYSGTANKHFYLYQRTSGGSDVPSAPDWVDLEDGERETVYRLTNTLTAGKKYLIVNDNQTGSANAVKLNNTSITSGSVTVENDTIGNYIKTTDNTLLWTYTNNKLQSVSNTGRYLRADSKSGGSLRTTGSSGDSLTSWRHDNNGLYTTNRSNNYYINSTSNGFTTVTSTNNLNRVYIYEEVSTNKPGNFAKMEGTLYYEFEKNEKSKNQIDQLVKDGIEVYTRPSGDNGSGTLVDPNDYTVTCPNMDPATPGTYTYSVVYKGKTLGHITVVITGEEEPPTEPTDPVDPSEPVDPPIEPGEDYPGYPNPGAVRVDKDADTTENDFRSTGVARVDLSATGVPMKKGVDVVVIVDTSSSMNSYNRIQDLRSALGELITTLKTPVNDQIQDIDLAIADFNGYDGTFIKETVNRQEQVVDILNGGSARSGANGGNVMTGNGQANAGGFEHIKDMNFNVNSVQTASGTNYDFGMEQAYDLLAAKKAANAEPRDQYVIFMSDGAPFKYNYFTAFSGETLWNNWLQGTVNNNDMGSNSHKQFYAGQRTRGGYTYQPHWTAEAIKGSPEKQYPVIDRNATASSPKYMKQVDGLGATLYTIGFGLEKDNMITVDSMNAVLGGMASDETKYINASNGEQLHNAFQSIATTIKKAGTDAVFTDQMGKDYKLQLSTTLTDAEGNPILNEKGQPIIVKGAGPNGEMTITVSSYQLYKRSEIGTTVDGVLVTEEMVGNRKPVAPTIKERVTFSTDGSSATSTAKTGEIISDGKINAQYFTYDLNTETFEWHIGDITEEEIVLSYYVYLEKSMEGERDAGSYPTNEFADLHYTNWRGNKEAVQHTTSPQLPWDAANVSYAFYLVNENGQIITDPVTGKTGSFPERVNVTQPAVYSTVPLNSGKDVSAAFAAKDVLPEGYVLYEGDPNYHVQINSNGSGSWEITNDQGKQSTYVTGFGMDGNKNYSNAKNSDTVNQGNNDYTHTTVWFAVVCTVSPVPDAVVIDFGLPVDINVLGNDIILGVAGQGEIVGVGPAIDFAEGKTYKKTETLDAGYVTSEYNLAHGIIKPIANDQGVLTKVRYTPTNMTFGTTDVFSYAVQYTGTNTDYNGIYYTNVKVIPATNIYYEDNFVTLADGTQNGNQPYNKWVQEGTYLDGTQAEDRPGKWNLSDFDANNVYGYDPSYDECRTFSMGSAAKVTVTNKNKEDVWPTATFTFTGTGFDLTAVSSNTVGAIFLELYEGTEATGTPVLTWFVDQYYGYSMVNGEWVITPDTANALYQIPVISRHGLKYGTYTAVVTPKFASGFAHGRTQYDFYMDAVRVYDPGLNDNDANDAHDKDNEGWPQIMEIRDNLIAAEDFDVTQAGTTFVWIDGKNTGSLDEFEKYGPKNEVYLISNQAVAFRLNAIDATKIASVQIGAKAPNSDAGETASLYVNGKLIKELTTATNMYYDITTDIKWNGNTSEPIVIHTGENDNILSLTDIKITFTDAPANPAPVQVATDEETVLMAMAMMAPTVPDPEPTEPEPTDPEPTDPEPTDPVFEPETFEISLKKDSVKAGQTAVVTVTTSADVARVTLDGADMNRGKVDKKTGLVTWTYEITMEEAGEHTFTAVAYNEEDIAAEEVQTATITVTDKGNGKDNGKGNQKETTEEAESEAESVSEPETEPAETEPVTEPAETEPAIMLETEPAETESETESATEPLA